MSMAAEPEPQVPPAPQIDPGTAARRLVRTALKASLATLDRETGHPYASLVLVATEPDGSPILLISRLAQHTRNLEADARAAILFDGTDGLGDPLTGGRVTVSGEVRPTHQPDGRAPLPGAACLRPGLFGVSRFLSLRADYFQGTFHRRLRPHRRLGCCRPSSRRSMARDALINAEADIVAHMNADHADAVALYATAACRLRGR